MAIIGGKVSLIQPVEFQNGIVSIGDNETSIVGARSVGIGGQSNDGGVGSVNNNIIGQSNHLTNGSSHNTIIGDLISPGVAWSYVVYIGTGYSLLPGTHFGGGSVILGAPTPDATNHQATVSIGVTTVNTSNCIVLGAGRGTVSTGAFNSVCIAPGNGAAIGTDSFDSIVIGDSGHIDNNSEMSIVLAPGFGSGVAATSPNSIVIGTCQVGTGSGSSSCIGQLSTIGDTCLQAQIFGDSNTINSNSSNTLIIGNGNTIGDSSGQSSCIGQSLTVNASCPGSILHGNTLSTSSNTVVMMGASSSIGGSSNNSIIVGISSAIGSLSANCAILGNGQIGNLSNFGLAFSSTIGNSSSSSLAMMRSTIGDNAPSSLAMMESTIGATGGTDASENIAIGTTSDIADNSQICILIGGSNGGGSHIRANNNRVILIGCESSVEASSNRATIIGCGSSIDTLSTFDTIIGHQSTIGTHSDYGIIVGAGAHIGDTCTDAIVMGRNASVATGANGSQAYGAGATAVVPNSVVYGSAAVPINTMSAVSGIAGNPVLFAFNASIISANLDTGFQLLFKNSLGNIVVQQVKIDVVTGALTVSP